MTQQFNSHRFSDPLGIYKKIGVALIEGQSALPDDRRGTKLRNSLNMEAEIWWACFMLQNGDIRAYEGGNLQGHGDGLLLPQPHQITWAKDILIAIQTKAHMRGSWTVDWLFPWDEFLIIYKDFNGDIVIKGTDDLTWGSLQKVKPSHFVDVANAMLHTYADAMVKALRASEAKMNAVADEEEDIREIVESG